MPINPFPQQQQNDYSELLESISKLSLTGSGVSGFRYAKSAEILLPASEESVILGSSNNITREVYLINNSENTVLLSWNDGISVTPIPKELEPGGIFQDWSDGGLELRAFSLNESQLKIWIRSNKPIDYQVGLEEMVPVKVLLYAQTNRDYLQGDYDSYSFDSFGNNLNKLFKSGENLSGYKLFTIAESSPGKELNFTIQSNLFFPIAFQWFDPFELALQGFKIASDILNPENEDLPIGFISRLTREGTWASSINSLTETIKLKPNRCEFMGRFIALNPNIGAYDTAIITSYTPNSTNIYDGGTVTLGGF